MKYLLIFTIGPVQSLINHSRKISDMYAGSKLLSGLMREAIRSLTEKSDLHILFPVEESREGGELGKRSAESDIPNRLIVEISSADETYPARIGSELEARIRQLFLNECRKLLQAVGIDREGWKLAERQLSAYPEVYWMVEPYADRPYQEVYSSLFRRSQEVKGIRPFEQSVEPWNRKCMLFPEYNAVFVKKKEGKGYPANINPADICDITQLGALRHLVKTGEALSAIALVKRVYPNPEEICSLRQMLLRSRVKELPVQGPGKGDMLANAVYDIINGNPPDNDEYDAEMWGTAEKLCERNQKEGIRLSSYYAMVKLDGDNMGDEFLNRKTHEEQRTLSRSIGKFARKIPEILGRHGGIPVYAGGEDFLGFVPLDTLFSCLEELRTTFRADVGLNFSAGIAAAHLMQPLKEVAVIAEEMEGLAKQSEGKNACTVGIVKRSGEMVVTPPLCFDESTDRYSLWDWKRLVEELIGSGCSKALFYHLGDLFRLFSEEGVKPDAPKARVLIHEAAASSGAPDPDKITQRLMKLYESVDAVEDFMNLLNASTFLTREVNPCIT